MWRRKGVVVGHRHTTGPHRLTHPLAVHRRRAPQGSFEIVHIEDAAGNRFATRLTNIFVIGKEGKPLISLPKGKGVRLTIIQEQKKRYEAASA